MTAQQPAIRHWIEGNWAWTSTSLSPATDEVTGACADVGDRRPSGSHRRHCAGLQLDSEQ